MKKVGLILFALFLFIYLSVHFGQTDEGGNPYVVECTEFDETDSVNYAVPVKLTQRSWEDYSTEVNYCLDYRLPTDVVFKSNEQRWNVNIPEELADEEYWGSIYKYLYELDRGQLGFLQDSLKQIAEKSELSDEEFVHMIVSMVQDIPYNYVMPGDCNNYKDHPCIGNQRFGILSPVEFLYTVAGDCDTRTVLLYTLLKNLGFMPVIVNSHEYAHSMLAVNVTAGGDHIDYRGHSFYFWETTATGWQPGMIPPDMNNVNYWKIILDYENQINPTRYH